MYLYDLYMSIWKILALEKDSFIKTMKACTE